MVAFCTRVVHKSDKAILLILKEQTITETKSPSSENVPALVKETEDDTSERKDPPRSWDEEFLEADLTVKHLALLCFTDTECVCLSSPGREGCDAAPRRSTAAALTSVCSLRARHTLLILTTGTIFSFSLLRWSAINDKNSQKTHTVDLFWGNIFKLRHVHFLKDYLFI